MLCKKCGQEIAEGEKVCPICGAEIEDVSAGATEVLFSNEPEDLFSNSEVSAQEEIAMDELAGKPEPPKKKKKSPLLWIIPIIIVVVLLIGLFIGGIILAVAGVGIFAFLSTNKKTDLPVAETPNSSIVQSDSSDTSSEQKAPDINADMLGTWYLATGYQEVVLEIKEDGTVTYREGNFSASAGYEAEDKNKISAELLDTHFEFEYIQGILVEYANGYLDGQIFTRTGVSANMPDGTDVIGVPYSLSEIRRAVAAYGNFSNLNTVCELDFDAYVDEAAYNYMDEEMAMWGAQLVRITCCDSIEEAHEHCYDFLDESFVVFYDSNFIEYDGKLYYVMPARGLTPINSNITDDMITRISMDEISVLTTSDEIYYSSDVFIRFKYIDGSYKIIQADWY